MDEQKLNLLIKRKSFLDKRINFYLKNKLLFKQRIVVGEVKGHLEKSQHNLNFISDISQDAYSDWVITGCYYAVYHAALALILSKGYFSKNHDATLCVLIREFFLNINKDEIKMINRLFLDKEDLNFYISSKEKREDASYSGKSHFNKDSVAELIKKTKMFVDKIEGILNEN